MKPQNKHINLIEYTEYEFSDYYDDMKRISSTTRVDIMRPNGSAPIRWTYILLFGMFKTKQGIDGKGSRACGFAKPAIIDGREKPKYKLISIGDVVDTPFGSFRVEWSKEYEWSAPNYDNLKLIKVRKSTKAGK